MTSCVIAIYKPPIARLNRCLECVLPQVDEVIIVGDQDTPWPLAGIITNYKIKLVRHDHSKTGYSRKANLGAALATGEFLHFLNDDVYLEPDVIEKCLDAMKDGVAVVTHTLRYPNGEIQYAGKFRAPGPVSFLHTDYRKQQSQHRKPVAQESACGASMIVRRKAFEEAGRFDDGYLYFASDDDLAMKLRQRGWGCVFTPLATGIHEAHSSLKITRGWQQVFRTDSARFKSKWPRACK